MNTGYLYKCMKVRRINLKKCQLTVWQAAGSRSNELHYCKYYSTFLHYVITFSVLYCCTYSYFKEGCIVNSRYWNRKELWGSNSTNNLLLLASILQNIECGFITYGHGNTVITFAGTLSLIMTVPKVPFGSSIDY